MAEVSAGAVPWLAILCSVSLLLAVLSLLFIFRLGRSASMLHAALRDLQSETRPLAEAVMHSREAKDAVLRLAPGMGELHGRIRSVAEEQLRLVESTGASSNAAVAAMAEGQKQLIEALAAGQSALHQCMGDHDTRLRGELQAQLASARQANADAITQLRTETATTLQGIRDALASGMTALRDSNEARLDTMRRENSEKLEAMRATVDEKLHATLEQRLGESFKLVSDRLEQVHRGLGEMQTLAIGVGDLRKVLTNVKTRGTWGEVQLENLLDQILTPDQYEKNVATRPGSGARVEFALRLPGRNDEGSVYLPIDAKFPLEDYQRLLEAQDKADLVAVEDAGRALEQRIRIEGRSIRDKYVEPPHTTDFAVLYLSTEGLYAEVLRRPGLVDWLQRECKVVLSGPTTLAAMLNSLQMGFRTLAIEKRSSEVWQVLGAVKSEFGKFGEALAHTKRKLEEATSSIEKAQTRNNVLTRKLRGVDQLPEPVAVGLLDLVHPDAGDAP